jgi:multidrug efflux pump subunit AcrA (membrane-fusion protein)
MTSQNAGIDALRIDRSKAKRSNQRSWLLPAILVIAALGGGIWWWKAKPGSVEVRTIAVREQSTVGAGPRTLLNASGYVTARRAATVSSKVTGKVMEVNVEEGKLVEVNQVLAKLDSSNVEASLRLAEAQLESAQKAVEETRPNLDFAQRELKRFAELAATKVVSDSDLRRAEMEARAFAGAIAVRTHGAAVSLHQLLHQRQADPQSLRQRAGERRPLHERLEQTRAQRCVEAHAGILHGDERVSFHLRQ